MERPRAFMSDEVFRTILMDYILPYKEVNRFCPPTFIGHKDGEPLLNKRFPDRLCELATVAPDMTIDIYSHGLMLPKLAAQGKDFFRFLETLPNRVRYMMSHHPRNHDNSINDYRPVVEYLTNVLRHNPPKNVEFITVSHRSSWVTQAMQEQWLDTWRGLPITVHCNAAINPWTGRIKEEGTVHFNGCPYADFGHWFFGVTGNVIACCLDLEEEIVFGNVLRDPPSAMFRKVEAFYADQRARKVTYPVCYNCYGMNPEPKEERLIQLGMVGP